MLGKDLNRFNALVDSKSKSLIRVDGFKKKSPTHREVVLYLIENYSSARNIARQIIEKLPKDVIDSLMDEYPTEILSSKKNKLIRQYLYKKIDILTTLLKEVESNDESIERTFYIMGVRHYANCNGQDCSLLTNINVDDSLLFAKEPSNKYDPDAIQVLTHSKELLGYVPRYYNKAILKRLNNKMSYSCVVVDINLHSECSECIKVKLNMPKD